MSQYTSSFLLLLLITVCLSISEVSCSSSPSGQVPSAHKLDQSLKERNSSDHGNMIPQQGRPKRRFVFQGPILTLTLKDPFADERSEPTMATSSSSSTSDQRDEALSAGSQDEQNDTTVSSSAVASIRDRLFWPRKYNPASYSSFLNLKSLAPTLLYSIRSTTKPFPNYFPSLQSSSVTAGYKYDDVKNKPSFIEGELSFRKTFGSIDGTGSTRNMALEVDIGPSYLVKEQKGVLVVRVGGDGVDNETSGFGCSALARFVMNKGKRYLEHLRGSYKMRLPFTALGSISITPSYDFQRDEPACNIIGKSSSGRTAAVLDLNWDNPTLSVIHALDQRNTISPEISLYDAKILYNWSVALDSGAIKTRVDPCSAIQVTWIDQSLNGKWVTDFKLPLVGNPGPLAGDIRVRRQFVF